MLTADVHQPPQLPDLTEIDSSPLPQVDLLQFESWSCSEVSEVVRVHEGEHGHLILVYKRLISIRT